MTRPGTMRVTLYRSGLAAVKAICGCASSSDDRLVLEHVQISARHMSATDSYVGARVPLTTLSPEVEGHVAEPVCVPAAALKHALWRIGKEETAVLVVDETGVTVQIRSAGYSAHVDASEDLAFPDVGALIDRSAQIHPSDDFTFIDASRMGQVAGITPNGTTVVSRGALAAATVHDYLEAEVVVGAVMPVRTDYAQMTIGEADPGPTDSSLFPDEPEPDHSAEAEVDQILGHDIDGGEVQ